MTPVPAPLPDQLADAEGELHSSAEEFALEWLRLYHLEKPSWPDGEYPKLKTLTEQFEAFGREVRSTILARLTAAESAREAAVARAEKLEKALEPFAEAADNLELLAKQDGSPPAVYKAVFWHSALVAARAALAPPATAEET